MAINYGIFLSDVETYVQKLAVIVNLYFTDPQSFKEQSPFNEQALARPVLVSNFLIALLREEIR